MSVITNLKSGAATDTQDGIDKVGTINMVYITDSLFASKPIFDQNKILTLYLNIICQQEYQTFGVQIYLLHS